MYPFSRSLFKRRNKEVSRIECILISYTRFLWKYQCFLQQVNTYVINLLHKSDPSNHFSLYRAMEILMKNAINNSKVRATFATHNEESIDFGIQLLKGRNHPSIQFAQINGLGDHLSLKLTEKEIKVLKLLPCGTYDDVLPWLARRMQENNDAKQRVATEKHLILNELLTRFTSIFTIRRWISFGDVKSLPFCTKRKHFLLLYFERFPLRMPPNSWLQI